MLRSARQPVELVDAVVTDAEAMAKKAKEEKEEIKLFGQ